MRVFIAGASGRVAQFLIRDLVKKGHTVVAGARHLERIKQEDGVEAVALDLHADVEELARIIEGSDAVYFTAGSRGKDLLQTDAFGAVKLMQAAEKVGIKRFILLSSVFANRPEKWTDPALVNITNYNIAKYFADQWLIQNTNLNYTIIQPGNLQETKASGLIVTDVDHSMPNSIENVALVLSESLELEETYGQVITMADGDTPIRKALQNR